MKTIALAGIVATLLTVSACNQNNNDTPPFTGGFRVVNGVADSNSSGLTADISNLSTDAQNVQFGTASHIADIIEGSYDSQLTVNGFTFQVDNVKESHGSVTTVFALGTVGSGNGSSTAAGFPVQESLSAPPNGQFVVQYIDDSVSHPKVNIYLVAPGNTTLTGVDPTAQLTASTRFNSAMAVGNANYEIIITDTDTGNVIFDSGHAHGGVSLPNVNNSSSTAPNVLQIAILDASSSGGSQQVSLLVLDNNGDNKPVTNGEF